MIDLSAVTKSYKGSLLAQAEPTPYEPTQEQLKDKKIKELYAWSKIEEYNNKMMMYQLWISSMIDKSARNLNAMLEEHPLCKFKIKKHKNEIMTCVGNLNKAMLQMERNDLMPVIAHGATAWQNKYDGVGNLTMRVQQAINAEIQRINAVWQSCTHNAIANCCTDEHTLMVQLYELNGYCAIASSLLESFRDYACEMMQRKVNIKHNSYIFDGIKKLSHHSMQMVDELNFLDHKSLDDNKWWKMAGEALTNICLNLISENVNELINQCIFDSIKDYCDWYVANTVLYYKYNDAIPEPVKYDAKKYLKGKGEMMRFVSQIKYLANHCEMADVYDIMDELPLYEDKAGIVTKFKESIIHWADAEAERIAMKKQQIEQINSK